MNDTISVMEEGEYSVTVTITEDECYMMCDTVEITRYSTPAIDISQDATSFCENGTLILSANYTPGAPNPMLEWSTGENTQQIEIDQEGTYTVTVTDACGEMAEASINAVFPIFDPMVDISQLGQGCPTLTAVYTGGGFQPMYEWSTGEETESIVPMASGTYSVTVTDECGNVANNSIEIELGGYNVIVISSVDYSSFCTNNTITINAGATANGAGINNDAAFVWSNGDVGRSIQVENEGTYTVTVTDPCGITGTSSEDVVIPNVVENVEVTYELTCNEDTNEGIVVFTATPAEEGEILLEVFMINNNQQLSTTNPSRELTISDEEGNFRVTVTSLINGDGCGIIFDEEFNLQGECSSLFEYPIAFFPNGTVDNERTFGPVVMPNDTVDMDLIREFEFKIFNRWGEKVFESTDVFDTWDGTHNGEPAPSEAYIWYVTYKYGDSEEVNLDKGDITIIR